MKLMQRIPEYQGEVFMQEFMKSVDTDLFDFREDPFSREILPQKKSLLDVPCGAGRDAFSIAASFPNLRVVGIDRYQPCIDFARRTFQLNPNFLFFKVGDIYDLNSEQADVVRIAYSLHHLDDLDKAFASVRNVLPVDGLVSVGDFDRGVNGNPELYIWAEQRKKWGDKYIDLFARDAIVIAGVGIGRHTALYLDSRTAAYTSQEVQEALCKSGFQINFCKNYRENFYLVASRK